MVENAGNYNSENGRKIRYYERQKVERRKHIIVCFYSICAIFGIAILVYTVTGLSLEAVANNSPQSNITDYQDKTEESAPNKINEIVESDIISKPNDQSALQEAANDYDYSKPVIASDATENSYFNDAVFIGDSRTEGLILNTGLFNAISYTHKGLMVDTVFTTPVVNKNGSKVSVMDAMKTTSFSKVYIMLGINETGWSYNSVFIEKYEKVIDEIKKINPSASIYIQEILPVSNKVSSTHSYLKNKKINEFNKLIQKMAEKKQIYYIDTAYAVSTSDGSLPEDAAIDGIHLKKDYCRKWLEYLKTHTVSK